MTFYPYKDTLNMKRTTENTVVFEVEGNVTTQSGEYTNEKNGTMEFEVSRERAEKMAKEILNSD